MQFKNDQLLPAESRKWLACEIDFDGDQVLIVLAADKMLREAWAYGHEGPLYMDATHGLQRYGLKIVTVHVKTDEQKGASLRSQRCSGCLS